eukprot:897314-Alexandrium_andersonii.AAC.1
MSTAGRPMMLAQVSSRHVLKELKRAHAEVVQKRGLKRPVARAARSRPVWVKSKAKRLQPLP